MGAQGRGPVAAVVVGAVLMGLSPAPLNGWPLAWVGLVPLWRLVVAPGPRSLWQTFGLGCLWSGIYHGIVLSWITALHPLTWMGIPWLGSVGIALFAWGFITGLGSVTFGLWAVLFRYLSDRCRLGLAGRLWVGTALWCGLETLLSWGPLYWPSLSFTQSPGNLWILHLAQLTGPMGVTAAIVAVNGCWAEMSWKRVEISFRGLRPPLVGLLLILGLHGLGWALYSRPLADDPASQLRIGLIQGNIPTREKLTPAGTRQAIQRYTQGYLDLVSQGVDAVLTPEGAMPEIWTPASQVRSPIGQAVRQGGRVLWLGTFRPVAQGSRQLSQSLVTLDSQGQIVSQYNKVKLVPLGEYIPFEALLGRVISRLSPVSSSLVPGSPEQSFDTPFGRAVVGICYESAYSELFRRQVAKGGTWIMTASNNDPYPPRMMLQHHGQDIMRAIEGDRWMVRVTNTGISGIVTPHGQTVWLSPANETVTHVATIYRRSTRSLYSRWGDWLTVLLLGGGTVICWASRRIQS